MSRRSLGFAIAVIGIVVAAIFALADQIGIGDEEAFGWQQIGGLAVGVVVAVVGFIIATRGDSSAGDIER